MADEEYSDITALSREELCSQLRSANIKYDPKDSTERLKQKWLKHLKVFEETQVKSTTSEMATIDSKIKLEFELGKDDWETFVERLELYFTANNVNDSKKKAAILLTRVSADTYKLARNLCHPAKLKDKEYDEVVKIISDHLCPKPSEPMERCKFYAAKQAVTESVSDFVARLKELSLRCNFTTIETALRDQLVCGLKDHATRTELFKEEYVTYEKAYRIALACEKAEKNATSTEKRNEVSGHGSEVHFVKTRSNSNGRYWSSKDESTRMNTNAEEVKKSNRENVNCYCCGKRGHIGRECKHRYQACRKCKRQGHIEAACRSQQRRVQCLQTSTEEEKSGDASEGEEDVYEFNKITTRGKTYNTNNIINVKGARSPMYLKVNINLIDLEMEVDTGSYWSIISDETRIKYFPNLKVCKISFAMNAYNLKLKPVGLLRDLEICFNKQKYTLDVLILPGKGATLLGRSWLHAFGLWPLFKMNNIESKIDQKLAIKVANDFPKLFGEGIGCFNKATVKLVLKENTVPKACKLRHVPFALRSKVEAELNRLENLGHIERVRTSAWATPIVPIIKDDNSVRICGNFKLTVNPCLIINRHPLPTINEIFEKLQGGQKFTQIDLTHAYMQIPVHPESRDMLTIITHIGLFRYTKLTEGVASGPGEFQRIIEDCLRDINGQIAVYLDNIYVTGKDDKEHIDTLYKVLHHLENCGFRVNVKKCEFSKENLEILGFVIRKGELCTSQKKVDAIVNAPIPKNRKQLLSFLGLVTYYERFLPHRASRLKPLYDLTRITDFVWNAECDEAYKWLKKEITSSKVLTNYDPTQQLVLACDASKYGLSAILSHRYPNGKERPIAFASKVIPEKEQNRAIIDKEAGAIVFGFKKFYNYIYGREIILKTDHKPLVYIFGPNQEIPLTVASRLQRWAYFLSHFTYKIEYVNTKKNGNCDALSRLPVEDKTPVFSKDFRVINYVEKELKLLTAKIIAIETRKDKILSKIIKYVQDDWPIRESITEEEQKYYAKRHELYIEKDCLLWGYRVIIPDSLRPRILQELHDSHFGSVKMKMRARSYVWWPNIDAQLEELAATCKVCMQDRKAPPKVPLNPWPSPNKCWSRIHSDFLGPFHGHMFMIVIDAYSKWPEVIDMKTNTRTESTIAQFQKIFSRFGLPNHLVTDNGRQYTSNDFALFMKENGVKHTFSAPYHPATNGAAENFVGIFKDKINKMIKSGKRLEEAVERFLFDYRSTEHCSIGRSPAFMMFKREIRTKLDCVRPNVADKIESAQLQQTLSQRGSRNIKFVEGEKVWITDYTTGSSKKTPAIITAQLSPVNFEVEVSPGKLWKRHVDQMFKYKEENNSDNDHPGNLNFK